MRLSTAFRAAGAVLFLCALIMWASGAGPLALVGSVSAFAIGILRGRSESAAFRRTLISEAGDDWGAGIGPVPGDFGPIVPPEGFPPSLVRQYRGRSDTDINSARARDADLLAERGYYPTSENFVPGSWTGSDWIVAFLALVVLIGIIVLAYMIATKPGGTLTVIYALRAETRHPVPQRARPVRAPASAADRLAALADLRGRGLITEEEWAAKRGDIVGRL